MEDCLIIREKLRKYEKASHFWLSKELKLKRSFSIPYLLYIHLKVVESLLEELHEGIYASHMGGKSLLHRALTQGYWWSSMQKVARDYTKKCD